MGGNPYFFVFRYDAAELAREPLEVLAGRLLEPEATDEVVLGTEAAAELGKGVGDTVELDGTRYEVVGVARSGDGWRDAGALAPLETVQANASKLNVVTGVHVTAAEGLDPREVAAAIEDDLPELTAIIEVADYAEVDQGFKIMDAAELAISLLAVGIGAIGVMNTMIMSVFERTREIGVLRAVGWRGSRILRMVLLESLFLCLIAAALGVALGLLASRAVLLVPAVSTFLTPGYPPEVFVRALAVGVFVALVGAVYPAFRAVRLSPMEALRHE